MKTFIILQILFIIPIFCYGEENIAEDFLAAMKNHHVIRYSVDYTFTDESKGATEYHYINTEAPDEADSLIGGYYHYASGKSKYVYAGDEFYYYSPEEYGNRIVKLYSRKKSPEEFTGQEFEFMGKKVRTLGIVRSWLIFDCTLLAMKKELEDLKPEDSLRVLPDTAINNTTCSRISIKGRITLAFDKKSKMPVHYFADFEVQKHEAFYSNYVFDAVDRADVFSRKAFPGNYKFVSNPKEKKQKSLKIGQPVPDWELSSISDKFYKSEELSGKPTFIVFSEIGCVPCMEALPELNELHKTYDSLNFFGIYPLDSKAALIKLAKSKNISYEVLYNSKAVSKAYFVGGYPSFFIIDRKGLLRYKSVGFGDGSKKELEKQIEKILKMK